jgi:hypothetical protein
MKLKPHETTAIARPISRMVARNAQLHRAIRLFTDPVLLVGTLVAIVRVRYMFVRAVNAGAIQLPMSPLEQYEQAKRQAAEATRNFVQPTAADVPPNSAAGDAAAPPAASNVTVLYEAPKREHVPHVEPTLAGAMAQIQDSYA